MNLNEDERVLTTFQENNLISHLQATVRKLERKLGHYERMGNKKDLINKLDKQAREIRKQQETIDSLFLLLDNK